MNKTIKAIKKILKEKKGDYKGYDKEKLLYFHITKKNNVQYATVINYREDGTVKATLDLVDGELKNHYQGGE